MEKSTLDVLYVGSGKSAMLINDLDLSKYTVVGVNNSWRLFDKFDIWIHSGDFPHESRPPIKNYDLEISYKQYSASIANVVKTLKAQCNSPQHYVGYTIFFLGLYWIFNDLKPKNIFLLGFDHDYNPKKLKKWNDNDRPNPQNYFLKPKDQSIKDWSATFFKGMETDFFYGHGTPDPIRLGMPHLQNKMKQAIDNARKLGIQIFNLSPVESEFNQIITKRSYTKEDDMIENELSRIKQESIIYKTRGGVMLDTLKLLEDGDIFEFGVFTGNSLRFISKHCPNKKIYAFDSFEGLPEAWPGVRSNTHKKGHFNVHGNIPNIDNQNISYIKGFFEDTLPSFVKNYDNKISMIHIDCDIYSSTKTIFHYMKPYIKQNTILLFDELIGYQDFEINEIKAWIEFIEETNLTYKYLYSAKEQVSLKIL